MKRAPDLSIRIVATSKDAAEAVVVLEPEFAGFAGHFPGAPVLPGMCHVDIALRTASLALGTPLDLVAVERARFVRRVSPGETMEIRLVLVGATLGSPLGVPDNDRGEASLAPTKAGAEPETVVTARHSVDGEPVAELQLRVTPRASAIRPTA